METNIPNQIDQPKQSGRPAIAVLIAVFFGLFAAVFPPGMLAAPAFWAYAMLKTSPTLLALFGGAYAVAAFLLRYPVNAAVLSACMVLAAFALYWLQTKRMGNTNTALTLAGVFLLGLYLSLCLPPMLEGKEAFADVEAVAAESIALWREMLPAEMAADPALAQQWNLVMDAIRDSVTASVVPMLSIAAAVLALSNLTLFRRFARSEQARLAPMQKFCMWSIPRSMMTGLFAMLVGTLILELSGWEYALNLTNAVQTIVAMPLILQGLCVIDFYIGRKSRNPRVARTVTFALIAVFLVLLQTPLMILGCMEQLFGIRRRMLEGPTSRPMTL